MCQLEFVHGNEGFPCGTLWLLQRYEAFSSVCGIRGSGLRLHFFFLTRRLQTLAREYSVAFLVVALAYRAWGRFGNFLSCAHVRAASQSCYICHGAEHVSI